MPPTTLTKNNVLNYNFGGHAYTPSADIYFGLSTSSVDATGLASVTEPFPASGYTRVSYSNDATPQQWTVSSGGALTNTVAITFPKSTADWGTILSIFIADSATRAAGNILWYYNFTPSVIIQNATVITIPVSYFEISLIEYGV